MLRTVTQPAGEGGHPPASHGGSLAPCGPVFWVPRVLDTREGPVPWLLGQTRGRHGPAAQEVAAWRGPACPCRWDGAAFLGAGSGVCPCPSSPRLGPAHPPPCDRGSLPAPLPTQQPCRRPRAPAPCRAPQEASSQVGLGAEQAQWGREQNNRNPPQPPAARSGLLICLRRLSQSLLGAGLRNAMGR